MGECRNSSLAAAESSDWQERRNTRRSDVFVMLDMTDRVPYWVLANVALAESCAIYRSKDTEETFARH